MEKYLFSIVIEKDADGYYAECPALQGCYAQGGTFEEAVANIRDAMELHVQDRLARGEAIAPNESVSVTTLEIAA